MPVARPAAAAPAKAPAAPPSAAQSPAVQAVSAIPQQELTPRVREALVKLLGEVEQLRRDLETSQRRILELERLADMDTLSAVANRRAFVRELARAMNFAERYATATALLFFDVNGLKQINDTHGHAAGDAVLRHVADTLQANVRASDVVGRLGGDEYAVILTHATEPQAQVKADQLAARVAETPVRFERIELKASVAVGVYSFQPGENPTDVLARADQQMYARKRQMKSQG